MRAANRVCLADLKEASNLPKSTGYWTKLSGQQRRRIATDSLRIFRPLERALQACQQVMRGYPRAQNAWLSFASQKLAPLALLCRTGVVHPAYCDLQLPLDMETFAFSLVMSPTERGILREQGLENVPVTPAKLIAAFAKARERQRIDTVAAGQARAQESALRNKRLAGLLARDLSDEALDALRDAVTKESALRGMGGLLEAVTQQRGEASGEPLITVESSLRFRLECAEDKLRQAEDENRELRAKLRGEE